MASKRRLRRNECGSKKRFPTERAAKGAMLAVKQKMGGRMYFNLYKCVHCAAWHFGHGRRRVG